MIYRKTKVNEWDWHPFFTIIPRKISDRVVYCNYGISYIVEQWACCEWIQRRYLGYGIYEYRSNPSA